jgi:hypothetical protein
MLAFDAIELRRFESMVDWERTAGTLRYGSADD